MEYEFHREHAAASELMQALALNKKGHYLQACRKYKQVSLNLAQPSR